MADEPNDDNERIIDFETSRMLRRVTVPGTDIELHEPSGLDETDRRPLLADEELDDRAWTVQLLQHQATSPESAQAIEQLNDDKLL